MILFLSEHTKNSVAVREEITYAASIGLPIIVVYPDFKSREAMYNGNTPKKTVADLRAKLSSLASAAKEVPVVHIPMDKALIRAYLNNKLYMVNTKCKAGNYACLNTVSA